MLWFVDKKISRGPISNLNAHREEKMLCKQIRHLSHVCFHKLRPYKAFAESHITASPGRVPQLQMEDVAMC